MGYSVNQSCPEHLYLLISVKKEYLPLLDQWGISSDNQTKVLTWYEAHAWSSEAMLEAHRPFSGVLETIRWFQMQPKTAVGLNTARPD